MAQKYSNRFSFWWGIFCCVLFIIVAKPIAHIFSHDPLVVDNIVLYLTIVPFGYGLQGVFQLNCACFNAINRPYVATTLNIVRMFVLLIPLAFLGAIWIGLKGLFGGVALANMIAGILSIIFIRRIYKKESIRVQPAN